MNNIKLPGVLIKHMSKQKSIEKYIYFKSVIKILDNETFINPHVQNDLDEDKVREMVESYLKNPEYLVCKNKIIICTLLDTNIHELYLVDGQHRLAMAKILYNDHDVNDYLSLCYIQTQSHEEIESIFNECNKDSYKNKIVFDKNFSKKKTFNLLKILLKRDYSESFATTKSSTNYRYSITEFIDIIFENIKHNISAEEILKDLNIKNKKFNKLIDYQKYYEKNPGYFYKDEFNCICNGIVFVLKHNNFLEYLLDDTIIPNHDFKNKQNKYSPQKRINVWKNKFGDDNKAICPIPICEETISNEAFGFAFGILDSNCDIYNIDNLTPMCITCYRRMGSFNYDDYYKKKKKEYKLLNKE